MNNKENLDARKKAFQKLIEQENKIRIEKNKYNKEIPWYLKPQNVIAVFAILFPIIVTIIYNEFQKDNKEISIKYSTVEPIISNSENIKEELIIKYDSTEVNNISKIRFIISNSGNNDITKNDFEDGPISFILNDSHNKTHILNIKEVNNAGQQNSKLSKISKNRFTYIPSLLNINDNVIIDVFLLNTPNLKIDINGKIINGKVLAPVKIEKKEQELGLIKIVESLNYFFKYKIITIVILTIFFALLAITSLFVFVMISDKQIDKSILSYSMSIVNGILSLLSLILIILTITL